MRIHMLVGSSALVFALVLGAAARADQAPASAYGSAAHRQTGPYGGGFVEFLVTGGTMSSRAASQPGTPVYNRPSPAGAGTQTAYAGPIAPPPAAVAHGAAESQFMRQQVAYSGNEKAGTIVIDTAHKFLFLVEGDGRALRYGIGVGREGFMWAGTKTITRKAEWPTWTPPATMRLRRPSLPITMAGGPANPLGARALYLGSTLYRIHGTNEPDTIGKNVSSGCIRMMNDDVEDLYDRVPVGTKVVVL